MASENETYVARFLYKLHNEHGWECLLSMTAAIPRSNVDEFVASLNRRDSGFRVWRHEECLHGDIDHPSKKGVQNSMKTRECECRRCGHKWTYQVKLSSDSPSLSGETRTWCPKCHKGEVTASQIKETNDEAI